MTIEIILNEFLRSYVQKRLKRSTQRGYRVNINNHLVPFMGDTDLSDLSYGLLDDFCGYMNDKGLSNTTTVYALAVLRKAINFGMRRGYLDRNIFDTYDMPRKEDFEYTTFGAEQCQVLLSYLQNRDDDALMPIYFALRHGLRRGECMGIKCEDIDRTNRILHIRRSITFDGKNLHRSDCKTRSSRRDILLDPTDLAWIDEYSRTRPQNQNGYLCRDHEGGLLSTNVVQHHFVRALSTCGLPRIRFHDLRHTFATYMMESEVNPKILSATLGHSDVKTTLSIYQHGTTSMQTVINARTHDFVPAIEKKQD